MKKLLCISSIFVASLGFGQTITGVGNFSEPDYGLVGLPACGTLAGSTFTITGNGNLSDYGIGLQEAGNLQMITVTSNVLGFILPNVTFAGLNNDWKLSGTLLYGENQTSFGISVLACPQNIQPKSFAFPGETITFTGNDLDLVAYISLDVSNSNNNLLEVITVPSAFSPSNSPNPTYLTFQIPNTPTLLGKNLLPTFVSSVNNIDYPVQFPATEFFTINSPPHPPLITTVLGLNSNQITILGSNFANGAIVNYGGFVSNGLNVTPTQITFTAPKGLFAPYITVTNPSSQNPPIPALSAKWYFTPTPILSGSIPSLTGSSFDMFTLAGSQFGLALPYSKSNFPPSLLMHDAGGNISTFASESSNTNALLLNQPTTLLSGIAATKFKRHDIDGDGYEEVVYASGSSLIGINLNNSSNSQIALLNAFGNINDFDFGDFNGDGLQDVMIYTEGANIYLNSPMGYNTMLPIQLSFQGTPYNLKTTDINADGKADISYFNSANKWDYIINSDIDGSITGTDFSIPTVLNFSPPGINISSYLTDINNDGNIDFASLNVNDYSMSGVAKSLKYKLYSKTSGYTFGIESTVNLPNNLDYLSLASADFNGDGYVDFIVNGVNSVGGSVFAYLTNTAGTGFDVAYQTFVGEAFTELVVADFNQDGGMDIAATNSISGITIFKNNYPCLTPSYNAPSTPFSVSGMQFNLVYSGSKLLDANWSISIPGTNSYQNITTLLGINQFSLTDINKNISSLNNGGNNYHQELIIFNVPLSFAGSLLTVTLTNVCGNAGTVSQTISLPNSNPCTTVSASNFSISGAQVPIQIGSSATFALNQTNNPQTPITFTWYSSVAGVVQSYPNTPNNGNPSFTISNFPQSLSGANIFAVASYCGGSFTVNGANTIATTCVGALVAILQNITVPSCIGGSVKFIQTASRADFVFWQTSLDKGINWLNLPENGTYTGTNTSELTVVGINNAIGTAFFRPIFVSTLCGISTVGTNFEINLRPSARVLRQPTNPAPTCPDNSIILDAAFSGNITAYQWQQKAPTENSFSNITAIGSNIYQGFTSSELVINLPKAFIDSYQYRLVATESCGGQASTLTTNTAKITIVTSTSPIVISQTSIVPICNTPTDVAKLSATAVGVNMAYQWYEKIGTASATAIVGNTANYSTSPNNPETLNITNTEKIAFANRQYFVEISGNCGVESLTGYTTSTGMQLQFFDKPILVANLSGNCIFGQSSLAIVPDTSHKSYQWLVDGKKLIGANTTTTSFNLYANGNYSVLVNGNKNCFAANYLYTTPLTEKATIATDFTDTDSALVASQAIKYQWFVDGRFISGATTKRILNYFNGRFHVVNTYENECQSQSEPFLVTVPGWRQLARMEEDIDINMLNKKPAANMITEISILPNPSQGQFEVKLKASNKAQYTSKLYSLKGEMLQSLQMQYNYGVQSAVFDVIGVVAGIYQLQITGNNEVKWAKVVIY